MDVIEQLFILYVAVGIMLAGFGMMLGGPPQAKAALRYFFLRPLKWLLATLRSWLWLVLGLIASAVLVYVLAPIGRSIARAWRWLTTRERGSLRKWVWPS